MMNDISFHRMTEGDLEGADELRRLVGWDQTLADWRRFLKLGPQGCFVATKNSVLLGTVTSITYFRVTELAMTDSNTHATDCPFCGDRLHLKIIGDHGTVMAIRDRHPVTEYHTLGVLKVHTGRSQQLWD